MLTNVAIACKRSSLGEAKILSGLYTSSLRGKKPAVNIVNDDDTFKEDLIDEVAQYSWLLDHIPAEIGVFDREGRFLFNTPSGIRDAAMRAWVVGKTHHDYVRKRGLPVAFADKRQQSIGQCVEEKGTASFEEPIIDREGRQRYYLRTFSPVTDADGVVTHVIGYGHEITELKKTEAAPAGGAR